MKTIFSIFNILLYCGSFLFWNSTLLMANSKEINDNNIAPINQNESSSIINLEIITTIDLEKTEYANLGMNKINDFVVDSEDFIYFHQNASSENFIFKFDKSGNFITAFGNKGQGPGELQRIYSMNLNADNDLLVLDGRRRKIIIFNKDGGFLNETSSNESIYSVIPLKNGNFLTLESLLIPEAVDKQIMSFLLYSNDKKTNKRVPQERNPRS